MPKSPLDIAIEEGQDCLKSFPVIVLGSGASIPAGLPSMGALADHLKDSMEVDALSVSDRRTWDQFTTELLTNDLESALQAVNLTESLSDYVIEQTWQLVSDADKLVFDKILSDRNYLPLTRLYRHLFQSTHRTISVVTSNYDRLAEYAADVAEYYHQTGFSYGYVRQRRSGSQLSIRHGGQQARTVNIWKVHGCLDWFSDQDGEVIALMSAATIPAGRRPAIVTPGIEKYERTHREPFRSIIGGADTALDQARAYLCIGFGFNDAHIQPKLLARWRSGDAFLVVLTKTLSESVKSMLSVGGVQRFMALEEEDGGTRMWSHQFPDGVLLRGSHLWRLPDFLDQTA